MPNIETKPVSKNHESIVSQKPIVHIALLLPVLFAFLVALDLMGIAFKQFGSDVAGQIISVIANPFVALFIGLLATAIVQSSSTTTSMMVAMVAAGTLSLQNAVPMVMGANIGTTLTSTLVSFSHITRKSEFRKAVATATVHDYFNILVTVVLFPLEYHFHLLSGLAVYFTSLVTSPTTASDYSFNLLYYTVKPLAQLLAGSMPSYPLLLLVFACILLFLSLFLFTAQLKGVVINRIQQKLEDKIFRFPAKALLWGIGVTALIQSSSVTTSVVVPMSATGKISVRKIFPFIMGANIGTTVTALIAALTRSEAALSLAFTHLFFNLIGVILFGAIPPLQNLPILLARRTAALAAKQKGFLFAYLLTVFFIIPLLIIYFV